MTRRIEKIENSKHKQERVLIFLDDGSLIKITKTELLNYRLAVGQELPMELTEKISEDARRSELRVQAAQMASKRTLSKKEVIQKLKDKGAKSEEAEEIAQWLEELGAVNDETYAGIIVRHYAAMGYGTERIRQEFIKRGIDKTLWENALLNLTDTGESIRGFIEKKMKGKENTRENIQKISSALLRRGFSWNEIKEAWKNFGETLSSEDL